MEAEATPTSAAVSITAVVKDTTAAVVTMEVAAALIITWVVVPKEAKTNHNTGEQQGTEDGENPILFGNKQTFNKLKVKQESINGIIQTHPHKDYYLKESHVC